MSLSSVIERTPGPILRPASVRLSRQISAAPERIFDAWLDAEDARRFLFAGRLGDEIRSQIEARVGGAFRIVRQRTGGYFDCWGEYLEIDRPQRLVFSLFVEKYAQRDDRVIVELAPVAGQSLLVLTHELSLPSPAQRSRIQRGWASTLDRLAALCTARRGGFHGLMAGKRPSAPSPPAFGPSRANFPG
jgi:uncharacterized protein YndB with AHSA1/START domain